MHRIILLALWFAQTIYADDQGWISDAKSSMGVIPGGSDLMAAHFTHDRIPDLIKLANSDNESDITVAINILSSAIAVGKIGKEETRKTIDQCANAGNSGSETVRMAYVRLLGAAKINDKIEPFVIDEKYSMPERLAAAFHWCASSPGAMNHPRYSAIRDVVELAISKFNSSDSKTFPIRTDELSYFYGICFLSKDWELLNLMLMKIFSLKSDKGFKFYAELSIGIILKKEVAHREMPTINDDTEQAIRRRITEMDTRLAGQYEFLLKKP
jgi:hypothetical protein